VFTKSRQSTPPIRFGISVTGPLLTINLEFSRLYLTV
jgi:hypothetical protein